MADRRGSSPRFPALLIPLAAVALLTGCSSNDHGSAVHGSHHRPTSADRALIRGYFQRLNASAELGPGAQAALLDATQDPSHPRGRCLLDGMTVRDAPAWSTLRVDPGWRAPGSTQRPRGTVFLVAVEVTIGRAGEVIGNQIGSVRLVLDNGAVHGFAPCAAP